MSYSEVLTGNKNINEAEVVMLTKVSRKAKQHENIQKNIVISGLPECTSSEVKERIESDRAAVNKLVEMLDVDKSKAKKIRRLRATRKGEQTSARPGVVIVEFDSSEDQVMALSNTKHLKKSEDFKIVFVNKDRMTAERIFEKQLRTKRDSLNRKLEETQSVNGIDRKYGVYEGRHFFWAIRGDSIKRVFINERI